MTQTHDTDVVALVGAGTLGRALLEALLGLPGVEVRYVFDADPTAPGIALAQANDISCRSDGRFDELRSDADVHLVLETTGRIDVLAALRACMPANGCLVDAAGVRVVLRLLAAQRDASDREAGERANVEKARYLRQASHQIKSPLSSIQSYVNVILGGYTGEIPQQTREIMEKIHARGEAALAALAKRRMLADLRCIHREDLEMSAVSLSEMVAEAVDLHAALAGERGVEIRVVPRENPDLARCDPAKTVALLSELIENAVMYSHKADLVEIRVDARPDCRFAISIRDHGIGIPERCLPRIFNEDYRADSAAKHYPDGVGLGLTIAREIADLHGFDLTVESEEGRGSLFAVTIPAAS